MSPPPRFADALEVLGRHGVELIVVGGGRRVRVLDLDAVIATKEATGRDKDRAMLPLLRETQRLRAAAAED